MELILAYGAGLLTLINPCVLPVLPIVLATALQASRLGPVALAAGMSLSFVVLGMLVTVFGHAIGLTEDVVSRAGAVLMLGFGVVLLVPRFNAVFAAATAGFAARADAGLDGVDRSGLRATALRRMAGFARPVLGVAFILVGLAILFRLHHVAEAWAVQNLPAWLIDLSVSI